MAQYRKKPVVIEAFRWTGDAQQTEDPAWIISALDRGVARITGSGTAGVHMLITTLEWVMEARQGDYIIRGIRGELYPCKPDIFVATYEAVD